MKLPSSKSLATRLRIQRLGLTTQDRVPIPADLLEETILALEGHDARVTGLIRAVSTEVIRRRELNAHLKVLMKLLQKLRDVLRGYAKNHRDKVNLKPMTSKELNDTMVKARRNDELANEIDEALLWQSPPGAMGKP